MSDTRPSIIAGLGFVVLSTERRLQLADILRAAAADIVAGADPGPRLADLRAPIAAWEMSGYTLPDGCWVEIHPATGLPWRGGGGF